MRAQQLIDLFEAGKRRWSRVGNERDGVIIGLDLEARLFVELEGEIVHRVNPDALGADRPEEWVNPGGDGLWPAPEGTRLGYEYATGAWRVPPGLVGARFRTVDSAPDRARVRAEIDLVNSEGLGVPTAFEREVSVRPGDGEVRVEVVERIVYLGAAERERDDCLLAPWSLCQFDSGPGCEVVMPAAPADAVWDLYDPSDDRRDRDEDGWRVRTDASKRFQIGIGPEVPWIEFRNPERGLRARREAAPPPDGQDYVDISDAPPDQSPGKRGVRYSVYSDTDGFMEIEAAGGCPPVLRPEVALEFRCLTTYGRL